MLKIEYLDNKINWINKEIRRLGSSELEHVIDYIRHLKRLKKAYEIERVKAFSRPEAILEDDYYILDDFPRRSEFV